MIYIIRFFIIFSRGLFKGLYLGICFFLLLYLFYLFSFFFFFFIFHFSNIEHDFTIDLKIYEKMIFEYFLLILIENVFF
jgi:hypothetical protein